MRTPQDSEGVNTVQINGKLQGEPPFLVAIELLSALNTWLGPSPIRRRIKIK